MAKRRTKAQIELDSVEQTGTREMVAEAVAIEEAEPEAVAPPVEPEAKASSLSDQILWCDVRVDNRKFYMNSFGEVYQVNHQGFVDHATAFSRTVAGQWVIDKPTGPRGKRRLTPRMSRDLEIRFVKLSQRHQQLLDKLKEIE